MGEPEEAVKTYRRYTQIRPKNPLGHLESVLPMKNCAQPR